MSTPEQYVNKYVTKKQKKALVINKYPTKDSTYELITQEEIERWINILESIGFQVIRPQ